MRRGVVAPGRAATPSGPESPRLWVDLAWKLRQQGLSYQAIADRLSKNYRQVYRALNRERVRQWDSASDKRHRAERTRRTRETRRAKAPNCIQCGQGLSRPPGSWPPLCRKCRAGPEPEAPPMWWLEALRLWNEGWAMQRMSEHFHRSPGVIYNALYQLRKRGWPVFPRHPWRYTDFIPERTVDHDEDERA